MVGGCGWVGFFLIKAISITMMHGQIEGHMFTAQIVQVQLPCIFKIPARCYVNAVSVSCIKQPFILKET